MPLLVEQELVRVAQESHEPYNTTGVVVGDLADEEQRHEDVHTQDVHRRDSSRLRRMQDTDPNQPERRPSLLQRLGVAALDITARPVSGGARLAYDEDELPPRSPVSAMEMRQNSGLTRRKISAKVVRDAVQALEADGQNWHKLSLDDLARHFKVQSDAIAKGLDPDEAARRLIEYGPNQISEVERESLVTKFLRNMFSGFSALLLAAFALSVIIFAVQLTQQDFFDVQTLALAISLIIVVVVTATFTTYQEGQADSLMKQLSQMSAEYCYVVRGGVTSRVPSESIVPGDVIKIGVGEKVPADLRILEAMELKVNNAPLTGENVDVKLGTDPRHDQLFEARNIARCGCTFTSGHGLAIVFATGDKTFLGSIARATTAAETPDTLLRREVRRIIFFMGTISISLSALVLGLSFGRGDDWPTAIVYIIGIVIANVPEGLLPQITLALTLTAKRMLRRGVLVSNLEIIETLGAVTVICSDKTGTITCNRMTVSHVYVSDTLFRTEWTPGTEPLQLFDASDAAFKRLANSAVLNTDATFVSFEDDVLAREARGDASEVSLIKFFEPIMEGGVEAARAANKRVGCIPFNSANKFMISVNSVADRNAATAAPHCVFIKGAAERVLPRCTSRHGANGSLIPLDAAQLKVIDDMVLRLASLGERVLAFAEMPHSVPRAYLEDPNTSDLVDESGEPLFPTTGFTFIGLISLVDPPRHTVRPALDMCAGAGIQVYMVTGDHPATAVAICQSLGYTLPPCNVHERVVNQDPSNTFCVVHGLNDIPKFTDADWDFVFSCKQAVFARTMPEQKQSIVHHLHKLGAVVAMTGDGVNDASALKVAHVGIAMGSGSAVAREAAQVVLLNDDFGSIVEGIREGRLIFENLKKCVAYVLTHLVPEVIPFLITIISGLPLGMQTLVVLFIDLGTEMAPGITLAYEEPEDNIMLNPPRTPDEHMVSLRMMLTTYITVGLMETFVCYWSFFWVFYANGFALHQLWGTNSDWGSTASDLDVDMLQTFTTMCEGNSKYTDPCADQEAFAVYRQTVLAQAQAVYFLHLVWGQYGNLLARRTQVNSGISWSRMKSNPQMLIVCFASLCLAIGGVYVPGLNNVLLFAPHPAIKFLFTGLWVLPIFVGLEEIKKYFIRRALPTRSWLYRLFVF